LESELPLVLAGIVDGVPGGVLIEEEPVLAAPALQEEAVGGRLHRRVQNEVSQVQILKIHHELPNQAVAQIFARHDHFV